MKIHRLNYNTCQHIVFSLGRKHLILIVGYTDNCYSQFNDYDIDGNKKNTTEDLVLNDPKAKYDSPKKWIRYKFKRICTLPFKINYCWEDSNRVFTIKPSLWIRIKKVKEKY